VATLHVALVEPEIHWNTGNTGRSCLAFGAQLHLIEPLGFSLEAHQVKRAGLDYWPRVRPERWPSFAAFEAAIGKLPFVLDCHLVAGDFDYFLKVRVRDIADFNRLHGAELIALPGVRQTRTFFVMKEVVDNAPLEL